ncbi:septum formation family protein [Micromonospora costi]|uniref:septum formation family protein n=1 Tax=Micromonospora costi TaxID=1530042 RepID=UPI0033C1F9EE
MRRLFRVAIAAALVSIITGCGTPPSGTDGDLTDEWHPLAAAEQFTPRAGDCHAVADPTAPENYDPVDCSLPHLLETIHVGTFTGDQAARPVPPRFWSAAMRPAFTECDTRARTFVGADWRDGRLAVQAVPPSVEGWQGGARWFRCDLFVLGAYSSANGTNDSIMKQTGSLRGVLAGPSPLAMACFELDDWYQLGPVDCGRPHRYEYVGIWTSPLERRGDVDRDPEAVHARCQSLVYRFAKVPAGRDVPTGTLYRLPSEQGWARGDRGVRCYFWSGSRAVTGSVRGRGAAAVTVREP